MIRSAKNYNIFFDQSLNLIRLYSDTGILNINTNNRRIFLFTILPETCL